MEKTRYYAIKGYFNKKKKWYYFGRALDNNNDWVLYPGRIHFFTKADEVEAAYKVILDKNSKILRGRGRILILESLPDKIKVVEIKLIITESNIIPESRLKEERQKSAIRKLSRQELIDLDLEHLAILHKLSNDELEENNYIDDDYLDEIPF